VCVCICEEDVYTTHLYVIKLDNLELNGL